VTTSVHSTQPRQPLIANGLPMFDSIDWIVLLDEGAGRHAPVPALLLRH